MKIILALCALAAMTTAGFAQTAPANSDPETPAIATPETTNPTAPVAGENSFTENQARERIEDKGYTNVADLHLGDDGVWRARAEKSGAAFEVTLDYQGNVTEGASD